MFSIVPALIVNAASMSKSPQTEITPDKVVGEVTSDINVLVDPLPSPEPVT